MNQKNNNALTFKATDFNINDSNSDIDLIKLEIKNLKENNETFRIQSDSIKKKVEDISVKVMDFDVFDVFKDSAGSGGSVDAAKILIKNIEQKFTHKNELKNSKLIKRNFQENKKANKKRESKVKRKSTDMDNQYSFNEESDEKDEDYYNYENMSSNKEKEEDKEDERDEEEEEKEKEKKSKRDKKKAKIRIE